MILGGPATTIRVQSGAAALSQFVPLLPAADSGGECNVTASPSSAAREVYAYYPDRATPVSLVQLTLDTAGRVVRYSERRGVPRILASAPGGVTAARRDSLLAEAQRTASTYIRLDYITGRATAHNVPDGRSGTGVTGGIAEFEAAEQLGRPAERAARVLALCGTRREARRAQLTVSRAEDVVRPRATREVGAGSAGGALVGRVVVDAAYPFFGAQVRLAATDSSGGSYTATTDDAGAFALTGIPAGGYQGSIQRLGIRPVGWSHSARAGQSDTLTFTLTLRSPEESPICTTAPRAAIEVVVRDSVAGRAPPDGVLAIVRDGGYVDTLRTRATVLRDTLVLRLYGAYERPGTYAITVTHPAYLPWRRTGVVVREGECHVGGRRFAVPLLPRR